VELSAVEAGQVDLEVEGQALQVRRGEAYVIPARVDHRTTIHAGARARAVHMDAAMFAELGDAVGVRELAVTLRVDGPRVLALSGMICAELKAANAGQRIVVEALVEALAVEVLRAAQWTQPRAVRSADPRIRLAVDLIHSRFAEPLAIDDIAAAAQMSRFHFSRRFLAVTGKSPYRYLLDVRLKRAAELLRRGRLSVTEVAFETGFSDLGRFGRMFRQRFGCTPLEYGR
jgi:AraC-like DNA-binding protein